MLLGNNKNTLENNSNKTSRSSNIKIESSSNTSLSSAEAKETPLKKSKKIKKNIPNIYIINKS